MLYTVEYMKKIILSIIIIVVIVSTAIAQTLPLITPSHESKIIMMGIQDNNLYTLDSNGLLRNTNINNFSSTFSIPTRKTISQAFFSFPYIVMIDTQFTMYVYNLQNKFVVFTAPFLETSTGTIAFSSDLSLFSFTGQSGIQVFNTVMWTQINQYNYQSASSQFLFISKNNQNLMSYYSNGQIEYYSIPSSTILKSTPSEIHLNAMLLNSTLRYAIGYTSNTVNTIDMISGTTRDSLLFNEQFINIYPNTSTNKDRIHISTLSLKNNGEQNIRVFTISPDGSIIENDLIAITLPNNSTSGIIYDSFLYIGFEDGQVWRYPISKPNANPQVIIEDNTLAIYDAIYETNNIILSTIEGTLNIPIVLEKQNIVTSTDFQFSNSIPSLNAQPMNNPTFIISKKNNVQVHTDTPIYLLSSTVPYSHTILPLERSTPTIYQNQKKATGTLNSNNTGYSLLFSLEKNTFHALNPIPIKPNLNYIYKDSKYTIAYSTIDSQLYIKHDTTNLQIPLFSSRFIFDISYSEIDNQLILWTNTPLITENINTNILINTIYSYQLINGILVPAYTPYSLPFVTELYSFNIIQSTPSKILVTNYKKETKLTTILLVTMPDPSQKSTTNIYPQHIEYITEISNQNILKIVPLKGKKNIAVFFTENSMRLITLDLEKNQLGYEHKISYPKEFGQFLTSTITPLIDTKTIKYFITLIDKNNTVSTFLIDQDKIQHINNFNIYNNKIIYF